MKTARQLLRAVEGSNQVDGAGVRLLRVLGPQETKEFDPFLMLDFFDSRDPDDYTRGFPWHPHRGIETVTYLIEGDIEHGDSLGNRGHILDGGCQWMTAGSGILHQEMPQPSPRMLGLQLWLNLPRRHKLARPQYRDLTAARIPKLEEPAGVVGVISGSYCGAAGPTKGDYVRATLLDVALKPSAGWQLAADPESTLFILVVDGSGFAGTPPAPVRSRHAFLFGEGGDFEAAAGPEGMRFVLFAGRPLREPIAWGGPIVMNTREELDQAFAEIENGTFVREQAAG